MNNPEIQAFLGTRHIAKTAKIFKKKHTTQKTNTMRITDPANITGGEHKF